MLYLCDGILHYFSVVSHIQNRQKSILFAGRNVVMLPSASTPFDRNDICIRVADMPKRVLNVCVVIFISGDSQLRSVNLLRRNIFQSTDFIGFGVPPSP